MSDKITMGNLFSGSGTWELAAKMFGMDVVFEAEIEPFPVAVEAKRFPEAIQLGDVSKISGAEIPPVDILTNSSPCFEGNNLVRTTNGLKKIKDVTAGDYVLTHTGSIQKVTNCGCTGHKKVMRLKAMGVDEIIATSNHPFYVRHMTRHYPTYIVDGKRKRGRTREFSMPEWKNLSDITKSDYIGIPVNNGFKSVDVSDEMLWLMGRYVADGYRRKDQCTVSFCIGKSKYDAFIEHIDLCKGYVDTGRTAMKYCITRKDLYDLCGECGDGAINKHFPAWAFCLNDRQLEVLFDGYMSGDGGIKKNGIHTATTISRQLAYDIEYAVIRLYKVPCRLYYTKREPTCVIEGRVVNQHDTYTVNFDVITHKQDKAFYEDGYVWLPIHGIEEYGDADVYNLTVENDNSYTVQNVAVHNCQDLSVAGTRGGLSAERSGLFKEAIRIAKEMREHDRKTVNDLRLAEARRYPRCRYFMWENVPGALSSNRGEDFRIVLESVARLVQEDAVIPLPPKGWSNAGVVDGDGWQIAWRIMDAQFYGVPQRRRRIFLVADLNGRCAGEVLFERESLPWHTSEIMQAFKDTSLSLGERISAASRIVMGGVRGEEEGVECSLNRE